MTQYQFNLSTTEPNNQIGLIRVRQDDDETQIFRTTVYENDVPKNLSGVSAEFNMIDVKQHIIVDKARVIDAKNGVLEYRLRKEALQSVGRCTAYFSFKNNNEVIFTTKDFNYNVIWSALSSPMHHGCDYVWTAVDLIESLKDWIEHAMGDFDDWFESVKEILASIDPGGIILKEIIDARNSTPFNMKHSTLKDRLNYTDSILKALAEIEHGFDLETFEPMYVGNLATYRNAVMQTFQIDPITNQYFVTQSDGKKPEGFVLSQTSPNGSKLLSTMQFVNGGHGTTFGLENENGKTIIWSFIRNENNVRKLIRVPYKANTTIVDSEALRDYTPESLKDTYFTPVVDEVNGYMLIRRGDLKCELRSLNDIKNGVDKILYTVTIPDSERDEVRASQGSVSHGTTLYWYSGVTSTTARVTKYDFKTGKQIGMREFDFPNERGDRFTDGYREPEGLAYYVNPHNGKESLLMGITTGELKKRYNIVYAIHQRGAQEHFDSIRSMGAQNYATTRGDGRAHSTPVDLKKLSDLRAAGEYYMTSEMVDVLTDLPSPQFIGSGMFIVNKSGNQNYNLRQIITRFSASRKNLTMERSLNYDGTFGFWSVHESQSDGAETINPDNYKNKLSNVNLPGEYYFTTTSSKAFTDHPAPNEAGWWLRVSSGSTGPAFVQELIRNSKTQAQRYQRVVNATSAGVWIKILDVKT